MTRLELILSPWKGDTLPLSYIRIWVTRFKFPTTPQEQDRWKLEGIAQEATLNEHSVSLVFTRFCYLVGLCCCQT